MTRKDNNLQDDNYQRILYMSAQGIDHVGQPDSDFNVFISIMRRSTIQQIRAVGNYMQKLSESADASKNLDVFEAYSYIRAEMEENVQLYNRLLGYDENKGIS